MNPVESKITLESGTNKFGLLEFLVGGNSYGINVAKVRELLQYRPVQPMPHAQASVEGIISNRNELLTVINLAVYLNHAQSERANQDIFIITEFNKTSYAFHVHEVVEIHWISWDAIEKPNSAIFGGNDGLVTGVAKLKNKLISILDFEKIMADINPESSVAADAALIKASEKEDKVHRILVAEDSMMLRKMIMDALHKAGYSDVVTKDNGQDAWDYLQSLNVENGPVERQVSCLITDIEMPKMDGLRLTRLIKEDKILSKIPIVIFSSLISEDMAVKCQEVGANAQLSKPQIHLLVGKIKEFIS
jgi:two-component system, chemotaxis family, chemotaxis protein CheV